MMGDSPGQDSVFTFINSAFKLSEYSVRFCEGDSENEAFIRMIESVRHDLVETERLLEVDSVKIRLISTPGKLPYIKGVVINTKTALNEIGKWVERAKANNEGNANGDSTFESRVRWVFNDSGKLVNQRLELSTCHQALSTVLAFLTPLEMVPPIEEAGPPGYNDATFFDSDFISPWQRKKVVQETERNSLVAERGTNASGMML
jgi:hypothetical protein